MPFIIRPYRRFPVQCLVSYNAGPFQCRWTPRGLKSGLVPLHSEADGFILRRDLALQWKSRRTARSRLLVHVQNHAEDSPVRETLTSTGHDRVFWCAPEDAQKLLNELYSKNVE